MERTSADLVQLLADDLSGVDEALTEALSEGVQGFRGSGVQGFRRMSRKRKARPIAGRTRIA